MCRLSNGTRSVPTTLCASYFRRRLSGALSKQPRSDEPVLFERFVQDGPARAIQTLPAQACSYVSQLRRNAFQFHSGLFQFLCGLQIGLGLF